MATTTKKTTTKTAATKPAAKKTATAKPATKKATAAKPVVKKTTTAKPAVKKTAPVKTAVELSVTGNKKIGTLMKEFNKHFPYLRLKYVTAMPAKQWPKAKASVVLTWTRHLLLYGVLIRVATFPSAATRKSNHWRKSLTPFSASMHRSVTPQKTAAATTQADRPTK